SAVHIPHDHVHLIGQMLLDEWRDRLGPIAETAARFVADDKLNIFFGIARCRGEGCATGEERQDAGEQRDGAGEECTPHFGFTEIRFHLPWLINSLTTCT